MFIARNSERPRLWTSLQVWPGPGAEGVMNLCWLFLWIFMNCSVVMSCNLDKFVPCSIVIHDVSWCFNMFQWFRFRNDAWCILIIPSFEVGESEEAIRSTSRRRLDLALRPGDVSGERAEIAVPTGRGRRPWLLCCVFCCFLMLNLPFCGWHRHSENRKKSDCWHHYVSEILGAPLLDNHESRFPQRGWTWTFQFLMIFSPQRGFGDWLIFDASVVRGTEKRKKTWCLPSDIRSDHEDPYPDCPHLEFSTESLIPSGKKKYLPTAHCQVQFVNSRPCLLHRCGLRRRTANCLPSCNKYT